MIDSSVTIVSTPAELAELAAARFIEVVGAAIKHRGFAAVALAGGSTPRAMNAVLASAPLRSRVNWAAVRWYFGDERCVPPEHADSNYRMTRETLFEPLGIEAATIFRMRGEDEPHAAADAYEATLIRTLGSRPVFDALFLGMGPDGHTASLFPGTIAGIDSRRMAVANYVPKFAAYRITLTPGAINAARAITITAAGAEKADALVAVLTGPREPERYPSQLIAPEHGELRWIVDAAAARRLEPST